MSKAKRFDRRSLFDVFRRALATEQHEAAPPPPNGFSLTAFYERRTESGANRASFPRFSLRDGLTSEPGESDERT